MELLSFETINSYLDLAASKLDEDAPIAACLMASYNFDGFVNPKTYKVSSILKEAANTHKVFFLLAPDKDIGKALNSLPLGSRKIDFLIIFSHSSESELYLSSTSDGLLHVKDVIDLDLSRLSKTVNILFHSCRTSLQIAPAFQKKLPSASIWSSPEFITDAILFPSEPHSLRISLFNNSENVTDYPAEALQETSKDSWLEEIQDSNFRLYRDAITMYNQLCDHPSPITQEACITLLEPHAAAGDLLSIAYMAELVPEKRIFYLRNLVDEGYPPSELGIALLDAGITDDGIHYLYEGVLQGESKYISRIQEQSSFLPTLHTHALAGNRFVTEIYLTFLAENPSINYSLSEISSLFFKALRDNYFLKYSVVEELCDRFDLAHFIEELSSKSSLDSSARHLLFYHYKKIENLDKRDGYLDQGVENEDSWALYEFGLLCEKRGDYVQALDLYRKSNTIRGDAAIDSLLEYESHPV